MMQTRDMILFGAVGDSIKVYNLSNLTFEKLKGQDPGQLHQNPIDYITKFSSQRPRYLSRKIPVHRSAQAPQGCGILWNVFERFTEIDLHPDSV